MPATSRRAPAEYHPIIETRCRQRRALTLETNTPLNDDARSVWLPRFTYVEDHFRRMIEPSLSVLDRIDDITASADGRIFAICGVVYDRFAGFP
jgi:hypothetical protein